MEVALLIGVTAYVFWSLFQVISLRRKLSNALSFRVKKDAGGKGRHLFLSNQAMVLFEYAKYKEHQVYLMQEGRCMACIEQKENQSNSLINQLMENGIETTEIVDGNYVAL